VTLITAGCEAKSSGETPRQASGSDVINLDPSFHFETTGRTEVLRLTIGSS